VLPLQLQSKSLVRNLILRVGSLFDICSMSSRYLSYSWYRQATESMASGPRLFPLSRRSCHAVSYSLTSSDVHGFNPLPEMLDVVQYFLDPGTSLHDVLPLPLHPINCKASILVSYITSPICRPVDQRCKKSKCWSLPKLRCATAISFKRSACVTFHKIYRPLTAN
jgi:hypothetical protein